MLKAVKLTLIAALGIGVGAAATAQGKGGTKPPPTLQGVVVDASGKTIGPYESGWPARVLTMIGGKPVIFAVGAQSIQGVGVPDITRLVPAPVSNTGVLFAGIQCTGAAYIDGPTHAGLYPSVAIADGRGAGTIYVGAPAYQQETITTLSVIESANGTCSASTRISNGLIPILDVVDLSTLFAVPYTLR